MLRKVRNSILKIILNIFYGLVVLLTYAPFFNYLKFLGLEHRANFAIKIGWLSSAQSSAVRLLDLAKHYKDDWNYGNAIHKGHTILGMTHILQGNIHKAEEELIASANTPGSPQLNSFGPNMRLASELLKHGRNDVVLKYLNECKSFWELGNDYINYWEYQINKGESPNFGGNIKY